VAAGKIAQIASAADPRVVLGLATGSSPVSAYEALETRIDASTLDLCLASAFALDEYVGLPVGHPQSCRSVIHRDAANPLRLASDRVHTPNGFAADLPAAATEFVNLIWLLRGGPIWPRPARLSWGWPGGYARYTFSRRHSRNVSSCCDSGLWTPARRAVSCPGRWAAWRCRMRW